MSGKNKETLYEGVPPHLAPVLQYFLEGEYGYRSSSKGGRSPVKTTMMHEVVLRARIAVKPGLTGADLMRDIVHLFLADEDLFLDVVDATLSISPNRSSHLKAQLLAAGSAWTVSPRGNCLSRRVDPAAQNRFDKIALSSSDAATELVEAWESAYGRSPDPSDSWDHSIKSLEIVLGPIILTQSPKPTLGTIAKAIQDKPSKWTLGLESSDIGSIETLYALLKMVWPNPDRHGGSESRQPTQLESEAVLQIAITIVQWIQTDLLQLAPLERSKSH